ncbi:MAG: helix-turn-helix transcriptional regulator [Pseudomonadota bacterium]
MDIIDVLTQKLRDLMAEHQIRAAPLARRAELNESAVRDILRGRSKNPGIVTLQKIAGVMNLRPSALFEEGDPWPVIGSIDADGHLNRDVSRLNGVTAIENPFLTLPPETYSAVLARGAATSPMAYDGDYLIASSPTEAISDELLGRPAIVEAKGVGELIGIPQVGAADGKYHLASINAFGAAHRDIEIVRAQPILLTLPNSFVTPHFLATHASSLAVNEKRSTYSGPRKRS